MKLNERIKKLREDSKLSLKNLAIMIDTDINLVSRWENDLELPDIFILPSLARALGCSIEYLLTGSTKGASIKTRLDLGVSQNDLEILDSLDLLGYIDEEDNSVYDYIIKYMSNEVLDYLLNRYSLNELKKDTKFYEALIKLDRVEILIRLGFFINNKDDPLAIFNDQSLNIYSQAGLDLFLKNLSYNSKCYSKVFSMHENDLINPTSAFQELYSRSIYFALKHDNDSLALRLVDLFVKINKEALDSYNENSSSIYSRKKEIVASPKMSYPRDSVAYAIVSADASSIKALLNKLYLDEALALYSVNERFDYNLVPSGLFMEARMKREGETNKNKLFVASCVEGGIINIDKLITCNNFYLIKNALYSYPIEIDELENPLNATEINAHYLKGDTASMVRRNILDSLYLKLVNKESDLMTEEYFISLLKDNNIDMLVIKLSVRLEGILKNKFNLEGTFEEMINAYTKDIDDDNIATLFHKLRKERNSAVHADRSGMKLTLDELSYLIKYISSLDN